MQQIYVVEVQHASDHDQDGSWNEVERVSGQKAVSSRAGTLAFGYIGRPIRIREVDSK